VAVPTFLSGAERNTKGNYVAEHRQALEHLAPPSVLVDDAHRILNLSEGAGRYLLQPGGPLSSLAAGVVRPELRLDLQAALHRAFEQNAPTLTPPLAVQFNGKPRQVILHVRPYSRDGTSRSAVVVFLEGEQIETAQQGEAKLEENGSSSLVVQLRNELATTQAHLRTTRSHYEGLTEELRASNEELQSINEEYRSTSEELETSKEELQSINEELQTLNNELKLKLDVVSRAHNDFQNLMSATDVAILFLTTSMRINRFTPRLIDIFNVMPGDESRPISDFTHRLQYNDLLRDASRVLADLTPLEKTIKSTDGRWFLTRIRPYRTLDDKIEGVVVTFVDVTERQEAEQRWDTRQSLLLGELAHRVKNTLAVVQAVVTQTLRSNGVSGEVQNALLSRLQAIAKSHDLLVKGEWDGAEVGALAREQLAPYLGQSRRMRLEGPKVTLPTQIATPFALLLHELATNAVKYGGLSTPQGKVSVKWELINDDRARRMRLTWTENGGPPGKAPTRTGFGSYLIENGLGDARVTRDFRPEGLVCSVELSLPLEDPSKS
jgi:two-component system CheB/CheR fusion protein